MRHEGGSNGNRENEHSHASDFESLAFTADLARKRTTHGRENSIQRKAEAEAHRRKAVDFLVDKGRRGDIPEQDNHRERAYQKIQYVGAVLEYFCVQAKTCQDRLFAAAFYRERFLKFP